VQLFLVNREMVRRAVALQILEPEDIAGVKGDGELDPPELLKRLESEGWLHPATTEALARLVELAPNTVTFGSSLSGGSKGSSSKGSRGSGQGRGDSAASSAQSEINVDAGTVDAGRGDSDLQVNQGTETPSDDASDESEATPTPGVDDADSELNVNDGTVTGRPVKSDSKAMAMGGALDSSAEAELNAGRLTGAKTGEGPGAVRKGSMDLGVAAENPPGEPPPSTALRKHFEKFLDLSLLDPARREVLEGAMFGRIAFRRGLVTRAQFDMGAEGSGRLSAELTSAGLDSVVKEVRELCQQPRGACAFCFGILADLGTETCPLCGRSQIQESQRRRISKAVGAEGFPAEGTTFAGYEVLQLVAEGGMGVVFRARQTALNRIVALKVLRGGNMASKGRRRRFLHEARAAAELKHPSIVPVYEINELNGYPYYTMDFVDGPTLDEFVKLNRSNPRDVAALVRSIADAVQHFHLHGLIHRDLKPDNILVADGVPKIIDFGIAKKLGQDMKGATIEGSVLGTPHYMSPEQAAGRVAEVDTRTDIYAMGAILYELLTGKPPWHDLHHVALVVAIQQDDPPSVRSLAPGTDIELEAICAKAMAKERERRYQSAAELAQDLDRYLKNLPILARPASIVVRLRKFVRRRLPLVAAGTAIAVTLLTSGVLIYRKNTEAHREAMALLDQAKDESLASDRRRELVEQAIGKENDNAEALALKQVFIEKDRVAQAEQKQKAEREKAERDKEKAQLELEAKNAKEIAKAQEEKKAKEQAERRADELRASAEAEIKKGDLASAIDDLTEALVVLPAGPGATRAAVEDRKIAVALQLASSAINAHEAGQASRWLRTAEHVESSKAHATEIAAVREKLDELTSGHNDIDKARELARSSQGGDDRWLEVRALLEKALERGYPAADLKDDIDRARRNCAARGAELLAEGQGFLKNGDAATAIARVTRARLFDPASTAISTLEDECEQQVAMNAQREAALIVEKDPVKALGVLADAVKTLQNPELIARIKREVAARERLTRDPALSATLVYVPELPDLGVHGFYVMRTEVTNGEFASFVASGGYDPASGFWDEDALPLLGGFVDTTKKPGPRTWVNGGFGESAQNASLPVRGVTVYEARAYGRWLNRTTGGKWRLLSEREWEVAAGWAPSKGVIRDYPWGNEFDPEAGAWATSLPRPVGTSRDLSPLGVADSAGNVMEWVERPGQTPGLKKGDFRCALRIARQRALVHQTGTPKAHPAPQLILLVGFRLALDVEKGP
jgi:serine/threonine protein kinase